MIRSIYESIVFIFVSPAWWWPKKYDRGMELPSSKTVRGTKEAIENRNHLDETAAQVLVVKYSGLIESSTLLPLRHLVEAREGSSPKRKTELILGLHLSLVSIHSFNPSRPSLLNLELRSLGARPLKVR